MSNCAVDEAHMFTQRGSESGAAGEGSLRSQRARELDMPYKMLMTGTPVRSSFSELYSLADWIQPGCLGTQKEFMQRYGKLATSTGAFDEGMKKALSDRLSGVMTGITLTVERDKDGQTVVEMKPQKAGAEPIRMTETTYEDQMTPEQAKQYKETYDKFTKTKGDMTDADKVLLRQAQKTVKRLKDKEGRSEDEEKELARAKRTVSKFSAGNPLTRDQSLKRVVNNVAIKDHPKVQRLNKLTADHPDERMVIFAQNGYSHETIVQGMGLKEGEYAEITGATKSDQRNAIAERLKDPNDPLKHVICSDAANFGLNMQGASVLVNYDLSDTYATHWQRICRTFRKGQKRNVSVYNLRTKSDYERTGQSRLEKKHKMQTLVGSLGELDPSGLGGIFAAHFGEGANSGTA